MNRQYRDIVRTARIFTDWDLRRKHNKWKNRYWDVNSTSTDGSNRPRECSGKIAKEHGTRPRMVWWWLNKVWRLVEIDQIIPQEQQGHGDQQQDHSDPSSPQERCSGNIYITKAQWAGQKIRNLGLEQLCERNQDNI